MNEFTKGDLVVHRFMRTPGVINKVKWNGTYKVDFYYGKVDGEGSHYWIEQTCFLSELELHPSILITNKEE